MVERRIQRHRATFGGGVPVRDRVRDGVRDRVGSLLGPRPPWPVPRGVEGPN